MNMKHMKYILALAAAAVTFAGCSTDRDEHHFENKLYINASTPFEEILFKQSTTDASSSLTVRTALPADRVITGKIEADLTLVDKYNIIYSQQAVSFPEQSFAIEGGDFTIEQGATTSLPVEFTFNDLGSLDRETLYVLPVRMSDVKGINVLDSKTEYYFVFKGASLINVVADIAQNHFEVKWKNDVSNLSAITVEALIRVRDFGNVGGLKGESMSTIFGIEGKFLVRIGDAGFPQNQLQLVNPNGNFPDGNSALGLPNNEWVHVAAVWDATSGDRIIYHNGKEIARDSKASGNVNLSDGACFIGKAYNDERWLDGEICELRVWNIQRTTEQIAGNFYEIDPSTEGLLAYWKFNEGQGKVVKDHSPNGNDVTADKDIKWTKVSLPENK